MTIDVMLPYFGDDPMFREAVRSVIAQTFQNWRLICVEDAHPDGAADDWLASLNDPRIIALKNETNLGVASNFARCLSLVRAPYFIMMGSDDRMLPGHLETLWLAAERHPQGSVFQTGVRVIDSFGAVSLPLGDRVKAVLRPKTSPGRDVVLTGEAFATSLSRADWAYFPSIMWQTSVAQTVGFDEQFAIALDLGLLLDIALEGGEMVVLDPVTFEYRRHSASVSMSAARSGARFEQEKVFFWHYADKFTRVGWNRAARVLRNHAVSRLNALTELPGALLQRAWRSSASLVRHAVGIGRP